MNTQHQHVRVYTNMVGDLFHWGHARFLERARALGTELIVGVHSDDDVASFKRVPIMRHDERVKVIAACRWVDHVLVDCPLVITNELLDAHEIDFVVHGDDFSPEVLDVVYRVPLNRGIMRTVPYTPGISTSEIIERARHSCTGAQIDSADPAVSALRRSRLDIPGFSVQRAA